MKNRRNYYRVLQVQPDAPVEVIRASYRTLMRELKQHPDLGGSAFEARVLNEAYEALSDAKRRAAYDKGLYSQYTNREFLSDRHPLITVFCPVCKRPLERKPQPDERCSTCHSPLQSQKPPEVEKNYRRSISRMAKNEKIFYCSSWPGKALEATMIDVSPRGMRFLCSERLIPGTGLRISSRMFEATASVMNSREERVDGQSVYSIGVSFVAVRFAELKGSFFSESA
jgi:hypothetical protein